MQLHVNIRAAMPAAKCNSLFIMINLNYVELKIPGWGTAGKLRNEQVWALRADINRYMWLIIS